MTDSPESTVVRLREGAIDLLELAPGVAAALNRRGIADVTAWSELLWKVSNVSRVGALRLEGVEVRIAPKVPMRNLFNLVSQARSWDIWLDEALSLNDVDELQVAIAEVFLAHVTQALRPGVLRGYLERRDADVSVRGRMLVAEQLRRRHGLHLPVELQYDDFSADIPVNRILRTAARRLLASGALPARLRSALLGLERALGEATLLTRGAPIPDVSWDRQSERYRAAVGLAELILTGGSLDHRAGDTIARGFLLDLSRIFEEFVEAEVRRAVRGYGGRIVAQERVPLDRDGRVHIKPDLVWRDAQGVRAVFNAKYKAEKPAGFPNADIYQMLVYCIRHRVPTGHLIYAAGNEPRATHVIEEADVTILCHALDLDAPGPVISAQVDAVVAQAFAHSSFRATVPTGAIRGM